ncbi:MAG TPA: hypothetical protein DHW71_07805, partial [Gammaproteobacteria bacterium]|nr:hypothetical protein [Gammaproteobacteria bacterium]
QGQSLTAEDFYSEYEWLSRYQWDRLRELLEKNHLIAKTTDDKFLLSRSLDGVSQYEVLEVLGWISPSNASNDSKLINTDAATRAYTDIQAKEYELKTRDFSNSIIDWCEMGEESKK